MEEMCSQSIIKLAQAKVGYGGVIFFLLVCRKTWFSLKHFYFLVIHSSLAQIKQNVQSNEKGPKIRVQGVSKI